MSAVKRVVHQKHQSLHFSRRGPLKHIARDDIRNRKKKSVIFSLGKVKLERRSKFENL